MKTKTFNNGSIRISTDTEKAKKYRSHGPKIVYVDPFWNGDSFISLAMERERNKDMPKWKIIE